MKPSASHPHVSTRKSQARSEGSSSKRWGGVGPAVTDTGTDTSWVRPIWMRNLENRYQRLHKKIAAIPVSKLPSSYRLNPLTRRFLNLALARAGKRLGSDYSNTQTAGARTSFTATTITASSQGDDSGRFSDILPRTVSHHRDSLTTEEPVSHQEVPNHRHCHQYHHHRHINSLDSEEDSLPVTSNDPPSQGSSGKGRNRSSVCDSCCPRCFFNQTRTYGAHHCQPDRTTTPINTPINTTTTTTTTTTGPAAGGTHPDKHLPVRTSDPTYSTTTTGTTKTLRDSRRTSEEPTGRDETNCSKGHHSVGLGATGSPAVPVGIRPAAPAGGVTASNTAHQQHQLQYQQNGQQQHQQQHSFSWHSAADGCDHLSSCRYGHGDSMVAAGDRDDRRSSLAALKQEAERGGGGGLEGGGGGGGGDTQKVSREDMGDSSTTGGTRKFNPAGKGRKVRSTNRSPTNNNNNNNSNNNNNNNNNHNFYHHHHRANDTNAKLPSSTNGNQLPVLSTYKGGGSGFGGGNGGGGVCVGGGGGAGGSEEEGEEKSDGNSLTVLPQMSVEARHAISETLKEMGTTDSFDLDETFYNGQHVGQHNHCEEGEEQVFDDDDDDNAKSLTSLPSIADPLPSLPVQRRSWHPTSDDYHLTTHHHLPHPHHHAHHPLHNQSRENSLTASQKTTARQKSFRSSRQPDTGSSVHTAHKGSSSKSPRRSNKRPPSLRTSVNNVRMAPGPRSERTQEMVLWDEEQAEEEEMVDGKVDLDLLSIPSGGICGSNRSSPDARRQPVQRMHLPAITSRTEPSLKRSPRKEANIRHINYRIRGVGSYRVPRENTFEITAPDFDIRYREVITCQKGDRETPPPEVFEKSVGKVREWLNKYYSYSPSS